MLISLRGTNGSGKSTVIRALMRGSSCSPIYGCLGPRQPEAYELGVPGCKERVFLLGPYQTPTGGCDRLQYEQVLDLIKKYEPKGHVIFEGIIVTSVYGRVGALMEQYKTDSVFVFLDTPLEVCLERVEARRGGKARDERLIKNVTNKFNSAARIKERVASEGIMRCFTVSSSNGAKVIKQILMGKM